MSYTILLFAGLKERLNCGQLEIELHAPSVTPEILKQHLIERYPEVEELISLSYLAINQVYAKPNALLYPTDEIALIPPVSGG